MKAEGRSGFIGSSYNANKVTKGKPLKLKSYPYEGACGSIYFSGIINMSIGSCFKGTSAE